MLECVLITLFEIQKSILMVVLLVNFKTCHSKKYWIFTVFTVWQYYNCGDKITILFILSK